MFSAAAVGSRIARMVLLAVTAIVVLYLALVALRPNVTEELPEWLSWFGEPASWPTIAIVVALLTAVCVSHFRTRDAGRADGLPLAIIVGLGATTIVLGFSSLWGCSDESHASFFTPLLWTFDLLKGDIDEVIIDQVCPAPTAVALDIAQLTGIATILFGLIGAAAAIFRSQTDRLRASFAKSVTAVVGIDDDGLAMVGAIKNTLDSRSTLAVITTKPERSCVLESRQVGARVVAVAPNRLHTLENLSLWRHVDRLYLLSADPATNLVRLDAISRGLSERNKRQRIPVIVRIDDPWQAEAWRAQRFGGSDTRWAADAVGLYEVTARRLLDQIIGAGNITRILVCGTSPLTLALCGDSVQRRLERDYYADPSEPALPSLTLVANNAEECLRDIEFYLERRGLVSDQRDLDAVSSAPTVSTLMDLIGDRGDTTAVIVVDADPILGAVADATVGTRLAARFPAMPIYAWDPDAQQDHHRTPIVGQLQTYRLTMDLPAGQAQDAWERAAVLIHNRYAAEAGHSSAAAQPWPQLNEFYRASNRRQVRNALWMVEQIGGHTWNTWGSSAPAVAVADLKGMEPLEQLQQLGFDRGAAIAMARAEHEDWSRHYRSAGWRYGSVRDDDRKITDMLVDWADVEANPQLVATALRSLAGTLIQLYELGYRSRPVWQHFRRVGTVTAEQRDESWTWTSASGDAMAAAAGDWAIEGPDGDQWSVRDDIFHATYEPAGDGKWRRTGVVRARPARARETVHTLEGKNQAAEGDWIVQGDHGEQWPVPADKFVNRYERER